MMRRIAQACQPMIGRMVNHWALGRSTLDHALRAVLPGRCLLCQTTEAGPLDLCRYCAPRLKRNVQPCAGCAEPGIMGFFCARCQHRFPAHDGLWVPWLYQDDMAYLIQRFKFEGDRAAGRLLLQLMKAERPLQGEADLMVLMPGHAYTRRERPLNALHWLGQRLAADWRIPLLAPHHFYRASDAPRQRGRAREARWQIDPNTLLTSGRRIQKVAAQRIVLLDDVVTTGASMHYAAAKLRQLGAQHIQGLAWGRTPVAMSAMV